MIRRYLSSELEGVATFWRILRRDGVMLAFTSHDRPLRFDNIEHRSAPGMVPSAIRRSASLDRDLLEVEGALTHDSITEQDLRDGRFTDAVVTIGLVDWETLDRTTLFSGSIGSISDDAGGFAAELRSAKALLDVDVVPRTSPTCRAAFCDADCKLNPAAYTVIATVMDLDAEAGTVRFNASQPLADHLHRDGRVRWIDGPHGGSTMVVRDTGTAGWLLDQPVSPALATGHRAYVMQGCDHTIATCAQRFGNAVNFQGEPFLPGNDLLTRYPTSSS